MKNLEVFGSDFADYRTSDKFSTQVVKISQQMALRLAVTKFTNALMGTFQSSFSISSLG